MMVIVIVGLANFVDKWSCDIVKLRLLDFFGHFYTTNRRII